MFRIFNYLLFFTLYTASLQGDVYSYLDLLNGCKREQIEALEEAKEFLDFSQETQFESLEGGLTKAKIYSFSLNGQKYVLRFMTCQPKNMREGEILALNVAHSLNLAPSCVFSDQNALLMIMPFIEGRPMDNFSELYLEKLGKMLKSLHEFSGDYPCRQSFRERLSKHFEKGIKGEIAYPTGFDNHVQTIVNQPYAHPVVPSHGDLNLSNLLINNDNITIIDWTCATWDHPFADLGYLCALANLSPHQEQKLLKAYFGREASNTEVEILKNEKAKVYLLTAVLWFRFSETTEDQTVPMQLRIAALDSELQSPDLKSAKEYIREGVVVDFRTAPKSAVKSYALSFYKAYLEETSNKG